MPRLTRPDFTLDPVTLAKSLLGVRLVRKLGGERLVGRIVETEAYCGPDDKAAHSVGWRRTNRTEPMYAKAGTSYVFLTYGMHHCFNVVCGDKNEGLDQPVAILIRALEPLEGIETMRRLRAAPASKNARVRDPKSIRDRDLCSGPAKLCQAMSIDRGVNAVDLVSHRSVWLERIGETPEPVRVINAPRVGVDYAEEWAKRPLRWFVEQSAHVSVRHPNSGGLHPKVEMRRIGV